MRRRGPGQPDLSAALPGQPGAEIRQQQEGRPARGAQDQERAVGVGEGDRQGPVARGLSGGHRRAEIQSLGHSRRCLALADACEQIGSPETEMFLLRWALDVDPKDPTVNRRAAMAFARVGQFDNAIGCWRRVEQAKPGDQEASKAISQLSVEQTIQKGGYQQEMLDGTSKVADLESAVRASMARGRKEVGARTCAAGGRHRRGAAVARRDPGQAGRGGELSGAGRGVHVRRGVSPTPNGS